MLYAFEPYVLRKLAEDRIFVVSPNIPFDSFFDCFHYEQPFFLVSQLEDGRVSVAPNAMSIPLSIFQTGYWPKGMLPSGYEYVTFKKGTYPVIVTAHPVKNFNEWLTLFTGWVRTFAKQTLSDFVTQNFDVTPIKETATRYAIPEPATID